MVARNRAARVFRSVNAHTSLALLSDASAASRAAGGVGGGAGGGRVG